MSSIAADHRDVDISKVIEESSLGIFQWAIVLICMATVIFDGFDLQAIGIVAPSLARAWSLSPGSFGLVFAAVPVGMILGAFSMGYVADRIGRKPVILGATFLFGGCSILTAAAATLPQMMVLRLLTGIGLGGVLPNLASLVVEYSPSRLRATLMTLSFGLLPFGSMLGSVLANWLIPRFGWQSVFLVGGIAPVAVAILAVFVLPESLRYLAAGNDRSKRIHNIVQRLTPGRRLAPDARFKSLEPPGPKASLRYLFGPKRTLPLLLLALTFGLVLFMVNFMMNWLPILLKRAGMSDYDAIMAASYLNVGGGLGAFMWGALIDRFGPYRVLPAAGLASAAALVLMAEGLMQPVLRSTGLVILGWCILGAMPGVYALIGSVFPTSIRATGVGAVFAIGRLGSVIGPLVGGVLIGLAIPVPDVLLFVAVPGCMLSATVRLLRRSPHDFN